jgi:hypothetical protein
MSSVLEVKMVLDSDDLYIDVPPALLEKLGWEKDTELSFSFDESLGVIYITQNNKD